MAKEIRKEKLLFIIIILIISLSVFIISTTNITKYEAESNTNNKLAATTVKEKTYEKKVLVVSMDPILTTTEPILTKDKTYKSCYQKRVSECIDVNYTTSYITTIENAVRDIEKDLEISSHNILDIKIVDINGKEVTGDNFTKYDYFPKYTGKVSRYVNGAWSAESYDTTDSLSFIQNFNEIYSETNWYFGKRSGNNPKNVDYLDYVEFFTNKTYWNNGKSIVDGINLGLYDEVWLTTYINVDSQWESAMLGANPYMLNARKFEIPGSKNFAVMNISVDRRDANLECFGHASESILGNQVFKSNAGTTYNDSKLKVLNGSTNAFNNETRTFATQVNNINDLDLWTRFTLNGHGSNYASVGNIHFSPNSTKDYEWTNETNINTSWADWFNYPNLTGKTVNVNFKTKVNGKDYALPTDYANYSQYGLSYVIDSDDYYSDARQHHRWWFYMLPHVTGRTADGYSNNWWSYIVNGDYVISLDTNGDENRTYHEGETITDLDFDVKTYMSQDEIRTLNEVLPEDLNVHIEDKSVVDVVNNKLTAVGTGSTIVTYYLDGISTSYTINVDEKPYSADVDEEVPDTGATLSTISIIAISVVGLLLIIYAKQYNKITRL